jgi:multimeric flavodoxin WrbA
MADSPDVRRGMPSVELTKEEFSRRFKQRFFDPAFDEVRAEIDKVAQVAWDGYINSRKSPRTRKAGAGFADPDYELSIEWFAARDAIREAENRHDDASGPGRILLINASSRSDQTCPGEASKTFRLVELAEDTFKSESKFELERLDLSHLAAEYGRVIYPCKACVSTAMPLCHWPCSCYPNNSLGQVNDWMNEIYPKWVAAHGIMIVTPVYWYQSPSPLKLMLDRLVCADGGNPDPTSTSGKDPAKAKALELAGWPYPRHLAGRAYAVFAHGDAAGVENVSTNVSAQLADMGLIGSGHEGTLGRYIGYYQPYATSHDALDHDEAVAEELRNAARALIETVERMRNGEIPRIGEKLRDPRPK